MDRLIARELVLSARRSGLWIAVALHALLSLAFLEAWGDARVQHLSTIQGVFLLLAAPWIAARIAAPMTTRDLPRMAILFGVDAAPARAS